MRGVTGSFERTRDHCAVGEEMRELLRLRLLLQLVDDVAHELSLDWEVQAHALRPLSIRMRVVRNPARLAIAAGTLLVLIRMLPAEPRAGEILLEEDFAKLDVVVIQDDTIHRGLVASLC